MIFDVFSGSFIQPELLMECADEVRHKYEPEVLILSEKGFRELVNAIYLHGFGHHIAQGYKSAGVKRVVWAPDVADEEFMLSSGRGLDAGVETLVLK